MKRLRLIISLAVMVPLVVSLVVGTLSLAEEAKAPVLPDKSRADILEIQLRMATEQNQYAQMQAQILQLQDAFRKDTEELRVKQEAACKAAGADCEKGWTLDLQTLKFVKKTEPPKK